MMGYKSLRTLTLALATPLLLTACGLEATDEGLPGAIDSYEVISGSFDIETRTQLRGSGTVAMDILLPGNVSKNSYRLSLNLLSNYSSVSLVAHSPSQGLNSGLKLTFTRSASNSVDVIVTDGTGTPYNTNSELETYLRPDIIDVVVEIDNTTGSPRILVWPGRTTNFDLQATYLDTFDTTEMPIGSPSLNRGAATGVFWGLVINNADVTMARIDDAVLVN